MQGVGLPVIENGYSNKSGHARKLDGVVLWNGDLSSLPFTTSGATCGGCVTSTSGPATITGLSCGGRGETRW